MKIFAAVSGSRVHTVCARRQLKLVSLFRKKIVTFYIKMHMWGEEIVSYLSYNLVLSETDVGCIGSMK